MHLIKKDTIPDKAELKKMVKKDPNVALQVNGNKFYVRSHLAKLKQYDSRKT